MITDNETCRVFAFRYCLMRRSYAVGWCIDHLRKYWPEASDNFKNVVRSNIKDAIHMHGVEQEWIDFLGEIDG